MAEIAAKVALRALHYGAPRIPDRVFESLPGGYFKPPEHKQNKKNGKDSRKNGRTSGYNSDHYTSGDENRKRQSRQSNRNERHRRTQSLDNEKKDRYADESGRFAGSGQEKMEYRQPSRGYDPYLPKPYNPQDYADPATIAAAAGTAGGAAAAAAAAGQAQPAHDYHDTRSDSQGYYQQVSYC
jgi:hypothetical protein